nr:GtrA family protein [Parapusillimonas granuli]
MPTVVKLLRETILFGVAGTVGFMVDTAVLYALQGIMGPFYARALSFLAAVLATWLINRNLAFRGRASALSRKSEFLSYLVLMLAGGLVNYGVYSALVLWQPVVRQHLVLGVAAGSLAGMSVNFLTARYLLFRK